MRKISDTVNDLIHNDYVALSALQRGQLNMHAYALEILPIVEDICFKPIKSGSIVVALSRIAQQVRVASPLQPKIVISDITMQSSLVDISYDRTQEVLEQIKDLRRQLTLNDHDFFTITEGKNEITLIAPATHFEQIANLMPGEPKAVLENLVAVTVSFDAGYLNIPNTIFGLLEPLAVRQINLLEIVSTYTQLSVIVNREEANVAMTAWQKLLP